MPNGIYCEQCKDNGWDFYYNDDEELCTRCDQCRFNPEYEEEGT